MEFIKSLEFWKNFASPVAALLVVFISNLVVLWKIRLDSKAAIKKELSLNFINLNRERLTKFYDPIVALLSLNKKIFEALGPKSFPQERAVRNEAVAVWNKAIQDVILPTNSRICELILQYSHLMDKSDDINTYLQFIEHAKSYEVFRTTPNEIHKRFPYPQEFLSKVKASRLVVKQRLDCLESETGMYIKEDEADGSVLVKK
jgi:hypothetical protein